MSLEKIMSVSGKPGLFRLITQTKSGFVVESIADKKRAVVHANQRVSMLKDITVYTTGEDKPLRDVLKTLRGNDAGALPVNPKSDPAELKKYFKSVVPDYDEDKVYVSDIRKIIAWHDLLRDLPLDEPEKDTGAPENQEDDKTKAPPADTPPPDPAG